MPLQVVRPWVSVRLVWTEGAGVAWAGVDKTVPNHLILPLEALSAGATGAVPNRTEVRALVGVHVHVRVEEILCLEGDGRAARHGAAEDAIEARGLGSGSCRESGGRGGDGDG